MTLKRDSDKQLVRRKWTKPIVFVVLVLIIGLLPLVISSSFILHVLILTFIYVVVAVSFRTISISGQFPLAHAAFMGVGAYIAGMASKWLGWPPWFTIPAAAVGSAVLGMATGYPFARLRALYYALGSLFFGITIINIIIAVKDVTGGYPGFTGIHPLFTGASKLPYYYFALGIAVISILACYRFEFSRIGVSLKAIAQSYLVASSTGINETFFKIVSVGVGCFFAGLAGATYGYYNLLLSWTSFNFAATLWIVMYVLIGGKNSFVGPIIGAAVLIIIPEMFRDLKQYVPFISAALLLIVVYLMPQGLVGLPRLVKSWFTKRQNKGIDRAA